jgi:hypothetical protein
MNPYYRAIPRNTGLSGIGLTDFPLRQGWANPMVVGQQPAPAPAPAPPPKPASLIQGIPDWLLGVGVLGGLWWLSRQ